MTHRRPTPERLGAFSDGVFAVIITIMVLELKPPPEPSFAALLPLWPTGVSYAVSYFFIAIVWVNHHHLLRFASHAAPRLVWWLRAPFRGLARAGFDLVGCGHALRGGSRDCL